MSSNSVSGRSARQAYVHVDVCEDRLEVQVEPVGECRRFPNDRGGVAHLVDLCRRLGVTKITMKGNGGECEFARHSLSFAGVSVTVADSLREDLFAARGRRLRRMRRLAAVLAGVTLFASVGYWQMSRVTQTVVSAFEKTRKFASDSSRKTYALSPSGFATKGAPDSAPELARLQKYRSLFGHLKGRSSSPDVSAGGASGQAAPGRPANRAGTRVPDRTAVFRSRRDPASLPTAKGPQGDVAVIMENYANSTAYRMLFAPSGKGGPGRASEGPDTGDGSGWSGPRAFPAMFDFDEKGGSYDRIFPFTESDGEQPPIPTIVQIAGGRVPYAAGSPRNRNAEAAVKNALWRLEARRGGPPKASAGLPPSAAPAASSAAIATGASRLQQMLLLDTFGERKPAVLTLRLVWPLWSRLVAAPYDACLLNCLF
jgi:hypothetical protein